MKALKAVWNKIRERFYSSMLVRMGVPTLAGGLILAVPAFGAGFSLGLMTNPAYWQGLIYVITFIAIGLGATLWGWFFDPVEERPEWRERGR